MTQNITSDNLVRRDWRGLLLVLIALCIYLVGPVSNHLDNKVRLAATVNFESLDYWPAVDQDCRMDPRKAIFQMKPIDLNLADAEVLISLKGIGPGLAERIIAYRDQHGGFDKVAEITGVRGVGPGKLAAFVDDVTVGKCAE